jgi:hypothetical protein
MQVILVIRYWGKFFDILEEVIIKKTTVETVVGFRYLQKEERNKIKDFGPSLRSDLLALVFERQSDQKAYSGEQKHHKYRRK